MASSREEQVRNNRRIARQMLGLVAILLMLIGLFTVIGWGIAAVRAALDDTERRQSYADRLYGLVMFDTLPFDDIHSVDPAVFKQAAIWGRVYEIQSNGGSLDDYERDETTGSVILPRLEVDTYLTNLLGPDYQVEDGSFETSEMNYIYDEERQGYLIPVTGAVGLYTPEVESIRTQGGQLYVTVGYIPTFASTTSLTLTTPTEPTKYMDYIFTRGEGRQWYLSALQESEMQPEPTATPDAGTTNVPTPDPQAVLQDNLTSSSSAVQESAPPAEDNGTTSSEPAGSDAAPESESTVDGTAQSDAVADTEPLPEDGDQPEE